MREAPLTTAKALLSIFRSRSGGGGGGDQQRDRDRESTIDKCDVAIEDGPDAPSRFVAKLVFRNGSQIPLTVVRWFCSLVPMLTIPTQE